MICSPLKILIFLVTLLNSAIHLLFHVTNSKPSKPLNLDYQYTYLYMYTYLYICIQYMLELSSPYQLMG